MFEIEETEVQDEKVIRVFFSGELTRQLIFDFFDKMAEYEEKYPAYKQLVYFTDVSEVSLNLEDLKLIGKYMKENTNRRGKTAFITGDNIGHLNLARYFIEMVSFFRGGKLKAFKGEEQAIHWLYMA